jgi:hypothetical protein
MVGTWKLYTWQRFQNCLFYLNMHINVTIKGAMLILEALDTDKKTHPGFIIE